MTMNSGSAPSRIDWADYAKGLCIIAVVTMYSTVYAEGELQQQGWMHYFVDFAAPFRMPDFFLLSGLFVPRVMNRPWRTYLDTKVLHFMYFYTLWTAIKCLFENVHLHSEMDAAAMLSDYFHLYIQPSGPLWFIFMLALFFIAARLLKPVPVPIIFLAAVALNLIHLETDWKMINKFGMYFIFFYSGHIFAPSIFRLAGWAQKNIEMTLAILAVWFAANLVVVWSGLMSIVVIALLTGFAGALAVILFSVTLMYRSWMNWVRYLGANSIVVYLGFFIPMVLLLKLITTYKLISDVGTISFQLSLSSIAVAVLMFWLLRLTPLRFLYSRPEWARLRQIRSTEKSSAVKS